MTDQVMPAEQTTATIEVAVGDDGPETTGLQDGSDGVGATALVLTAAPPEASASAPLAEASAVSLIAAFYEHQDSEGDRLIVRHSEGRYHRLQQRLAAAGRVSSIAVRATPAQEAGGELILFGEGRFSGKYQRFPVAAGESRRENLSFFINDEVTSALLLRRSRQETAIPIASLGFGPQITNFLVGLDSRISPAGRPVFTWDMWPNGPDVPAAVRERALVLVKVPFEIDTPGLNHSAEVLAWIDPFLRTVDGQTRFGARLAHLRLDVNGWIAGRVADEMRPRLEEVRRFVAPLLQEAVGRLMSAPVRGFYLLPGDGRTLAGRTDDDVTLVLVS